MLTLSFEFALKFQRFFPQDFLTQRAVSDLTTNTTQINGSFTSRARSEESALISLNSQAEDNKLLILKKFSWPRHENHKSLWSNIFYYGNIHGTNRFEG